MRQAIDGTEAAFNQLLDLTADWFAARGMQVNREEMLVSVDGYEPLFHIDKDPGSF